MPEVPHDETVALRLELGRMTDKANALEAALRKEVLAIVREEIQKQLKACGDALSPEALEQYRRSYVGHYPNPVNMTPIKPAKSPSFIEDLGNGVEKHDLLMRTPAKEGGQS